MSADEEPVTMEMEGEEEEEKIGDEEEEAGDGTGEAGGTVVRLQEEDEDVPDEAAEGNPGAVAQTPPEGAEGKAAADEQRQGGEGGGMTEADAAAVARLAALESAREEDDPMSQPPHGTEVFIGGLPRSATEDDVTGFCSTVGELHSLRLVKDPGNPAQANKGFCFAVFKTPQNALDAIANLNGKQVTGHPDSKPVRVVISSVKNRLFIGGIPKDMTKADIETELKAAAIGVEHVEAGSGGIQGEANRGFCFAEFYNHASADWSRQRLSSAAGFKIRDRTVTVTWAEPRRESGPGSSQPQQQRQPFPPQQQDEIKSVYVSKLPEGASQENLEEIFAGYGAISRVIIPAPKSRAQPYPEFAFVHFETREGAVAAMEACKNKAPSLNGAELEVAMARSNPVMQGASRGNLMTPGRASTPRYNQPGGNNYSSPGGGRGGYMGPGQGMAGAGGMMGGQVNLSNMTMVPMMLPNGQVGYVLQDPNMMGGGGVGGGFGPTRGAPQHQGGGSYRGGGGGYSGRGGGGGGRGRIMGPGQNRYNPY